MVKIVDQERWVQLIDECIGTRKKFSAQDRKTFAVSLPPNIEIALNKVRIAYPDNSVLLAIKDCLDVLLPQVERLHSLREQHEVLRDAEKWTAETFKQSRNIDLDIKTFRDFSYFLSDFIDDSYAVTSTSGINNRSGLIVCVTICNLYNKIFNAEPSHSKQDPNNDSGGIYGGSPYERVCSAVQEHLLDFPLTWSTRRDAVSAYQNGLNFYDKAFPDG